MSNSRIKKGKAINIKNLEKNAVIFSLHGMTYALGQLNKSMTEKSYQHINNCKQAAHITYKPDHIKRMPHVNVFG